jgi:RNA polymerase-binding transcription factor DksA
MPQTLRGLDLDRLERFCGPGCNSIRFGAGAPGLERAEVHLTTCAFERHRHDTYAIGITTAGVQRFWYREGREDDIRDELAAVERAEARLAAGTYGLSVESGVPIPDERLEAVPTAERTVEEEAR